MSRIKLISILLALLLGSSGWCAAESLDQRLSSQIHGRWSRPWLDPPMKALTAVGDAKNEIALCAVIALLGGRKGFEASKLALAAAGATAIVTFGLKPAVNRDRPDGPSDRTNSSFPSGHATGAFAIATVFSHEYPRLAIPCYLLASGVALSRVYLGRHYPSDVLFGAVLGWSAAKLALKFRDQIVPFDLDSVREKNQAGTH